MQHGDVVANNSCFTNDDGVRMINHNALTNAGSRVDVHAKHLRGAHLKELSNVLAPLPPQPIRDAIGLDRLKTLEK